MDFLKIDHINLFSYQLPFVRPVLVSRQRLEIRRGYVIKVTTADGSYSYGEIAPLPGLFSETFKDIPAQMDTIRRFIQNADSNESGFEALNLKPSVRFGVESALFNLHNQTSTEVSDRWKYPALEREVKINALLDPQEGPPLPLLEKIRDRGFPCVKIKLARQAVDEDIHLVQMVYRFLGDSVALRLDCNRRWSLEEATEFCGRVSVPTIEYLEEPLIDPGALPQLYRNTGFSLAVDESLVEHNAESLINQHWVKTIVLKPALTGGVFRTLELMHIAGKLNKKVVISDTYHSGVGLGMLICLSAVRRKNKTAAGLDTYSRLQNDILLKRFSIRKGAYIVADVKQRMHQVNERLLVQHDFISA